MLVCEEHGGARLTERVQAAVPDDPGASALPAEAARARRGTQLDTFRSLHHRNFRLLWLGTVCAASAQWIEQVTISWLTYELTGSPYLLGLVNGVRATPQLLLGPFAGVAADRVEPKRLMLTTQLILAIGTLALATLIATGQVQVWHLFLFPALTGLGWVFNAPVRQSIVPNVVPRKDLMNALALNSAGFNLTRTLGPALAGLMIAVIGPGENFFIMSAAYFGVVIMVTMIRMPAIPRARSAPVLSNLKEGALFVWKHPSLRTQMILGLVPVVIAFPYTSLMPIFATEVLGQGPGGLGLLMAAPGVGSLIGTLFLASLGEVRRKGLVLIVALFCYGSFLAAFSFSRSFGLSLALLFCLGIAHVWYMTTNQTMIQLSTPDNLRGRVMGIWMLNMGMMPFGSLFAGIGAGLTSAPTAVAVMGVSVALLAIGFGMRAENIREY